MPSTADLVLRPPVMADEAQLRAAHEELRPDGFAFLFDPQLPWGEQLDDLDREARGIALAPGRVPSDYLVGQVGPDIVGRVSIRHELTPMLLEVGGHIGYAVRPAFRRRGHATRMLELSVQRMAALGVDRVLVTCDEDNAGSARVIERCGGVLEDIRSVAEGVPGKRRYWIDARRVSERRVSTLRVSTLRVSERRP